MSFASEDAETADQIATGLTNAGFGVWYSRFELKVGDSLVGRITEGLASAQYGILLVSQAFLHKPWPKYETESLVREHIEGDKAVLPVWHGVSVDDVRELNPGLANIFAVSTSEGIRAVIQRLSEAIVGDAATVAMLPSYEQPVARFFSGAGELQLEKGGAFTLWEALLHFRRDQYPIWIDGALYDRDYLLFSATQRLYAKRDFVQGIVGPEGFERLESELGRGGWDPGMYG